MATVAKIRDLTESLAYEDGDDIGRMRAQELALDDFRDLAYLVLRKNDE